MSSSTPISSVFFISILVILHKAQKPQFSRTTVALQEGVIVEGTWFCTAIIRAISEIHIGDSEDDFRFIGDHPRDAHKRNSYLLQLLRQS
ncbi:MAG: exodeoxyribonuclease V alpha subunit [Pseudohongiellaceae bacterium]|jgi:exodeoxyribonuclease V alpha subunit